MVSRCRQVVSSFWHHVLLLQQWQTLRAQGLMVKRRGWLLVIKGGQAHRARQLQAPAPHPAQHKVPAKPGAKIPAEKSRPLQLYSVPSPIHPPMQ